MWALTCVEKNESVWKWDGPAESSMIHHPQVLFEGLGQADVGKL